MQWGKAAGVGLAGLFLASPALTLPAWAQQVAAADDVEGLSIEQLANVEITSVSKAPQSLSTAAAAVYVINHDDVVRSGAINLPEMLRLAPNLEVMQTSPSRYQISARGFNGNDADQNFPNKLLVLIDGRSVYTPLYSGVYWDMQDVLADDVERIEVVGGPGGTLWGANAVNGVIKIITRKASDTSGGVAILQPGDQYSSIALQYGGALTDKIDYRVYFKDFYQRSFNTAAGVSAHDGWSRPQAGFRLDWDGGADFLTLSGDIYGGAEGQPTGPDEVIGGENLTLNWQRQLAEDSSLQVLAYYDETRRNTFGAGGFNLDIYNLELQHNFRLADWNSIVWGIGDRIEQYQIADRIGIDNSLTWQPGARTLNLANIFAEDRIRLSDTVEATIGLKAENDPYSGISLMPSGKLSWQASPADLLWASISRAVRSPTPFDTDVVELAGTTRFLVGDSNFKPEQVTAYEAGYRGQWFGKVTLSISAFENVYDDLKSIEPTAVTFVPLHWSNTIQGNVHGVEIWSSLQATDWWQLSAGLTVQHLDLEFEPGASKILPLSQAGDDPHHQASLRSSMNLGDDVNFDADLRYVGALPDPRVPEYVELNARLGWKVSDTISLALSGYNLLHGQHLEYAGGAEIRRGVYLETRLRF
jgi:iron complex outermembrane receptor protein